MSTACRIISNCYYLLYSVAEQLHTSLHYRALSALGLFSTTVFAFIAEFKSTGAAGVFAVSFIPFSTIVLYNANQNKQGERSTLRFLCDLFKGDDPIPSLMATIGMVGSLCTFPFLLKPAAPVGLFLVVLGLGFGSSALSFLVAVVAGGLLGVVLRAVVRVLGTWAVHHIERGRKLKHKTGD